MLYPAEPFLDRIWELRDTLTVLDAWFGAVAGLLEEPLVTADAALLDLTGLRCQTVDARPAGHRQGAVATGPAACAASADSDVGTPWS